MKHTIYKKLEFSLCMVILTSLSACSSIGFLLEGEIFALGRASTALTVSEGAVAVTSESGLMALLSRTLTISRTMGRTTFILSLDGLTAEFELVAPTMLRRVGSTEFIPLAGRMARIKSTAKVQVKLTPSDAANLVRLINPERPLLVLKDSIGWCKVRIEEKVDGWVQKQFIEELYKKPEEINIEYSDKRNEREKSVPDTKRDCEINNTGEHCFTNGYNFPLHIEYTMGKWYSDGGQVTIQPGRTQCIESLPVGQYRYNGANQNELGIIVNGNFYVGQCSSKTEVVP